MATIRLSLLSATAILLAAAPEACAQMGLSGARGAFVRPSSPYTAPSRVVQAGYQQGVPAQSRVAKPFSAVTPTPGVSPYLALDGRNGNDPLLNYHLFVQPRLQQERFNAVQQAQYQRLASEMRTAALGAAAGQQGATGAPPNYADRFLNYGGYFPVRR